MNDTSAAGASAARVSFISSAHPVSSRSIARRLPPADATAARSTAIASRAACSCWPHICPVNSMPELTDGLSAARLSPSCAACVPTRSRGSAPPSSKPDSPSSRCRSIHPSRSSASGWLTDRFGGRALIGAGTVTEVAADRRDRRRRSPDRQSGR